MIDAARPDDQRQRRRLFLVTLTALQFRYPSRDEPEMIAWLKRWLGGWPGIGRITTGMARHGYDLQLTRYDARGWRATFYSTGMEHSAASATASAWERTPWHATQRGAWDALRQWDISRGCT